MDQAEAFREAMSLNWHAGDAAPLSTKAGLTAQFIVPDAIDSDLIGRWQVLENSASLANPFYEHWILPASIRLFARGGDTRLFTCWDGGELIGLMPIGTQPKYSRWPMPHWRNWLHPNAFLGVPLVFSGKEYAFWDSFLNALDTQPGLHGFLHLQTFPLGNPVSQALQQVCKTHGRSCDTVLSEDRALMETSSSAEAYYASTVRKKKRKELSRLKKRLSELGRLDFEQNELADEKAVENWCSEFLALEARGWKGSNGSALACHDSTRCFFEQTVHGAWKRGKLHRADLRLDGKPVAMLATLISGDQGFSFKTAYDEQLAQYSPGVLLQIENLGLAENQGLISIDSCAASGHPMIDSLWGERKTVARISVSLSGIRRGTQFALMRTGEKLLERRQRQLASLARQSVTQPTD